MLTVKLVADRAGVSRALVYTWVQEGILPHFRLGKKGTRGAIRVAESDLETFLGSLRKGEGPVEKTPPAQRRTIVLKHLKLKV